MYWMNGNVKNIVISETQKLYFEASTKGLKTPF
jgi:hypothetical protein